MINSRSAEVDDLQSQDHNYVHRAEETLSSSMYLIKTYREAPNVAVLKRNIMNRFIANMGPVFIPSLGTPRISQLETDMMPKCFSMIPPTPHFVSELSVDYHSAIPINRSTSFV